MPDVYFMNWNVEKLSQNKVNIPGMATNIGKVIATAYNPAAGTVGADVAIILELSSTTAAATMASVAGAAMLASVGAGGRATDYMGWLISNDTGGECYGVLIKDLNVVRPVYVTAGPELLSNLDQNQFATWPGPFLVAGALANAYAAALPAPAARPRLPLTDVYASSRTARRRARFAGQRLAAGGYAVGNGFRMPALLMFEVLDGVGAAALAALPGPAGPAAPAPPATYLVPVLACHLGAVRGGANPLARGQIQQYKQTHIAQKFRTGGYICLNGAARAVQELIITGDFNVDFLQNNAFGTALATGNRSALNTLTPTAAFGTSGAPAATPGNPLPAPAVPFVQPLLGWPQGPLRNNIPNLALRSGNTAQGTMLIDYNGLPAPPNTPALRGASFDNFLYGGVQLSANTQMAGGQSNPAQPNNACFVHDVPARIDRPPVGAGMLAVNGAYLHYLLRGTHNAGAAPALNGGAFMDVNARLIGARFISDHLPVVLRCNFT